MILRNLWKLPSSKEKEATRKTELHFRLLEKMRAVFFSSLFAASRYHFFAPGKFCGLSSSFFSFSEQKAMIKLERMSIWSRLHNLLEQKGWSSNTMETMAKERTVMELRGRKKSARAKSAVPWLVEEESMVRPKTHAGLWFCANDNDDGKEIVV